MGAQAGWKTNAVSMFKEMQDGTAFFHLVRFYIHFIKTTIVRSHKGIWEIHTIFREIMHLPMPKHKNHYPKGHEIYNFGIPFLGIINKY